MVAKNPFCSYCVTVKELITQSNLTLVTLWTVARQAPLSCLDFPGKNTRVRCHALLQGIFPTQGLNPGFPHCRQILYQLSHQGNPKVIFKGRYFLLYLFSIFHLEHFSL